MGEAKRRGQMSRTAADSLRQRLRAGDFGAPEAADGYLFVLDKSARGHQLLPALRAVGGSFVGLPGLLEGEAVRLWQGSPLFPFVVLHGRGGAAAPQALLAATLERLLSRTLPSAAAVLGSAPHPWAWEVALDDGAGDVSVRQALERMKR